MHAKPGDSKQTRAEMAGDFPMPPLPAPSLYLRDAFLDLGMCAASGMGIGPLPYAEIAAGAPWASQRERQTIREMSREYLAGMKTGGNDLGVPPWSEDA